MKTVCHYCGKECEKGLGHYNRAIKMGCNVYCNRTCAGFGRRTTVEEKKRVKSEYDKIYHKNNAEKKIKQAKEWFQKDYAENPAKYKKRREEKYGKHLEYLHTERYRKWKVEYDKKFNAKKGYGEFGEAAIILNELEKMLDNVGNEQLRFDRNCHNKSKKRKKLCNQQKNLQL